jgi:hypothetical protein
VRERRAFLNAADGRVQLCSDDVLIVEGSGEQAYLATEPAVGGGDTTATKAVSRILPELRFRALALRQVAEIWGWSQGDPTPMRSSKHRRRNRLRRKTAELPRRAADIVPRL